MDQLYSYYVIRGLSNSVILVCEKTKRCAIIDPSSYDKIISKIEELKVIPDKILITHGHYDHIFYADKFRETYSIKIHIHEDDEEYMKDPTKNYSMKSMGKEIGFSPDVLFHGSSDSVHVGDLFIKVLHTPGHTKGGVSYYVEDSKKPILFSGDTLFKGTIGRTDLFGGNFSRIISSIENQLLVLPEETVVIPGHGIPTKIKDEFETIRNLKSQNSQSGN